MQKVHLVNSELEVSRLAFGCWGITDDAVWGERDSTESTRTIHAAIDSGINFFDSAEGYSGGNSEVLLGKAIAGRRDRVIIATKARPDSMGPAGVRQACERSLQRLGTDYIDLFQNHWFDPEVPVEVTWEAMIKLKEEGKVRSIGVSNAGVAHLRAVETLQFPVTNQLPYNLLWRMIEQDILPHCRDKNIGTMVYSPLQHGLIGDRFHAPDDVPEGRARSRHFHRDRPMTRHGELGCEEKTFAAIKGIRQIAKTIDCSTTDLALAWGASQPGVSCIVVGCRNEAQLESNMRALEMGLSDQVLQQLSDVTEAVNRALGTNPDMWDGSGNGRYR